MVNIWVDTEKIIPSSIRMMSVVLLELHHRVWICSPLRYAKLQTTHGKGKCSPFHLC